MDEGTISNSSTNQEKKSSSFDELTREELIVKCNKFLLIARKAKVTKDELFDENKHLKEELDKRKEQNEVMQEMVENLTQNKLSSANQVEELNKQLVKKDVSIQQLQRKYDEVTIENESLKRQLQRLTDENDSLLSDMQSLESKLSNGDSDKIDERIEKFNEEISSLKKQYEEKCSENSSFKDLIDNNSIKIKNLVQENSELKSSIESRNAPTDEIKIRYEKVLRKLKAYREKLFEIYEQTKLLKAEKGVLLSLTKEYGEYVSNWQKDISNASTRLVIQIKELNLEIKSKNEEIKRLEGALETSNNQNCNENVIEEMKQQIRALNETIQTKDKLLEEEKEAQKKLKQSVKKPSVLDLELEAFEKTLDETNKKLEAKKKQVIELEGTISIQNETINSFKTQIATLEENLESEKAHSGEIKKNLDSQQNLLRKTEHERTESNLQLDLLTKNYESLKLENTEVKIEMSKAIGEMEKRYQSLESERNDLLKSISILENEVEKFKKLSSSHEKEIEDIRSEFVSYKVRAQSVLRQNQTKFDLGKEQELQDELTMLKKSLESFKDSSQKANSELESLKKNYSSLVDDKARLQNRCKDLLSTLEKQSEEMLEESRKRNQEHDESIKAYQLQVDTLNTFYKKRIQDLEESKQNSIQELQDRITALESMPSQNVPSMNSSEALSIPKTDDQKISTMLDLMDREVEGSEDQSSQSMTFSNFHTKRKISRGRELIPLDELLNSSFDNSNEINEETISNYSSPSEIVEHAKAKLQKEESRNAHLTSLLADSEKDLARMQQLNDMLKEEVRRHQRSIEREQHIQNSEYLKNIIIKFITLNNCDEKQRLIPVLNTILKLSSDELQVLQNSCKSGWALWAK